MERAAHPHPVSRRSVLAGGLALAASALGARRDLPIGLETFTVGEAMAADPAAGLATIAAMGYRTIEVPAFYGRTPVELARMARTAGLEFVSAHALPTRLVPDRPTLEHDHAEILGSYRDAGLKYVVCVAPWLPEDAVPAGAPRTDLRANLLRGLKGLGPDGWRRFADFLNLTGERARARGLRFAYHNHNLEFLSVGDERGFDMLLRLTDPALVAWEMDTGWVAAAGLDPVAYLREHAARVPLMHAKDLRPGPTGPEVSMAPAAMGEGSLDWPAIFAAATGLDRYYVEQEPPFPRGQLAAARENYAFLASLRPAPGRVSPR